MTSGYRVLFADQRSTRTTTHVSMATLALLDENKQGYIIVVTAEAEWSMHSLQSTASSVRSCLAPAFGHG